MKVNYHTSIFNQTLVLHFFSLKRLYCHKITILSLKKSQEITQKQKKNLYFEILKVQMCLHYCI